MSDDIDVRSAFMALTDGVQGRLTEYDSRIDQLATIVNMQHAALTRPLLADTHSKAITLADPGWDAFLRKGSTTELERKALSVGDDSAGGFTVYPQLAGYIETILRPWTPMRQVANIQQCTTSQFEIITDVSEVNAGWVGETDARGPTQGQVFGKEIVAIHEMYAMPGGHADHPRRQLHQHRAVHRHPARR